MNPLFIKASHHKIKEKYDYELKLDTETCYQELYDYIRDNNEKICTCMDDQIMAICTILATCEKYPDLKVVWIGPNCMLETIGSVIMGGLEPQFALKFKKYINMNQIMFVGIHDVDLLDNYDIMYLTEKKATNTDIVKKFAGGSPCHVHLDLTTRVDVRSIIGALENIVSLDLANGSDDIKLGELARGVIMKVFGMKEKSINIFTEDSDFLIYRSLSQTDPATDYGWYILRGMSLVEREKILRTLEGDMMTSVVIDGEDYLLAKTTMNEQIKKSYYTCNTVNDTVLFPEEKKLMCFDLLSSA